MKNEAQFIGKPVSSLQAMLRELSFVHDFLPRLVATGRFDEETLEAVMRFQRAFYPPVTGVVDNETWDEVARQFYQAQRRLAPPRALAVFPGRDHQITPGERGPHLYLIQGMFQSLAGLLHDIEPQTPNGIHSGPSVRNTQWLQRQGNRPPTGVMEKEDWDLLSRLYELFAAPQADPRP